MTTKPLPPHGTLSRHKHYGCKCEPCTENFRTYSRRRYRQKGYGTWQPYADAEPVRQHIAALRQAGHSIASITRDAQVSPATIARILYGAGGRPPAPSLRKDAADRILAIRPGTRRPADGDKTDGTGTRRRVQALVAIGWPLSHLAPLMGYHPRRLTDFVRAERVTIATARRVADAYHRLRCADPTSHGVPKPYQTMARNLARKQGWHGPMAWDDIDNPDAEPEVEPAVKETPRYVAIGEDALELIEKQGYTRQQAADRIGVTREYVDASICRYRASLEAAA